MEGDTGGPGPSTTKKRRANVGKACNNCRRRKSRCDGQQPECKTCQIYNDECTWGEQEDGRKPASRQYVNTLKNRIATLEAYIKEKGQDLPSPAAGVLDGEAVKAEDEQDGDDQDLDGISTTMLHLQMGEAGEQVHYYGPTSAFAHSSRDPPIGASPVEYKLGEYMNRPHDYRRYLPDSVALTQSQHTVILDRFFRFFASWGLRAMSDLFHQDMIRTVMLPPHTPLARFTHYSPFLHNIMLAIALMWADEEDLRETSTRAVFANKAESYLAVEIARPTLATVQGLALKSSYHSTLGDHTGGWAYFGMADRASLSLGLNLSCTALVDGGRMSKSEMVMRRNAFWCIFVQEQCWSVYIGRPHEGQAYSTPLPTVDDALDEMPWRWDNLDSPDNHLPPQPCMFSSAFVETTKLTLIMQRAMTTLYSIKSDVFKLQKDSTITDLGLALDSWAEQLPSALVITGHTMKNALPHIIMLQLAKEWCTILIYRPYYRPVAQMTGAQRSTASSETLLNLAVRRCDRSAARINSLLQTYHQRFGLRYTPPTLFNIAFTAGTTHLLSAVRHHGARIKNDALASARECIGFLHNVAESWPAAAQKADILDQLVSEYHPPEPTPAPTPPAPLPAAQQPAPQTQPVNIHPPPAIPDGFGSSSLSPSFSMSWPFGPSPSQTQLPLQTEQPAPNNFDNAANDQFLFSLLNHITLPPQATSPNDYVFMPPTDWSPANSIAQTMAPPAPPPPQQYQPTPWYNQAQMMGLTSSQYDRRPSSASDSERPTTMPPMSQMQWNGYFGSG